MSALPVGCFRRSTIGHHKLIEFSEISQSMLAALEAARGKTPSARALVRLAAASDAESAAWAFSQWDLRSRAKVKFGIASEMFFVREALEQASHEAVAAYHASRFPKGALVVDMTAGIGGDLIALARRGPVVGFELDAERAAYARHNLAVHGLSGDVVVSDSLQSMPAVDYAFVDPARRVEGRRSLRLEDFSPDIGQVVERLSKLKLGVMKLTPMLSDTNLQEIGSGIEFVSFGRECREALVYLGREAASRIEAVHVETGERLARCPTGATADEPSEIFFEADPAAIRANALGSFGLSLLGDSNGYLTGREPVESPWLRSYRVLWSGSGDVKKTRAELKRLEANPILKQRAGIDLSALAKQLGKHGSRTVFVAVWPVGRSLRHTILEGL